MQTPSPSLHARLLFLDWARIGAFSLLVLYHVGMYYVTWDWHIKSPHAQPAIEPWMRLVSPWRLDLLFLVSGAATSFMLLQQGAGRALLGKRATRLLVPLLFGMLVIVPPQSYFEVVEKFGFRGDYLAFMRLYLAGARDFCVAGRCLILPTWNHLWFLPYLFAYTCLLWLIVRFDPGALDRAARRLERIGAVHLFAVPILFLVASLALLSRRFPVTHAFGDDWFAHTQFLAMFLLGAVLARTPSIWEQMQRWRTVAVTLALASWVLLVSDVLPARGAPWPANLVRGFVYSTQQWCAIVAAIGFARRYLSRESAVRCYLTDAVFPVYVLHQTITILLARALAPAQLEPGLEATLLIGGTFALSFAGYESLRRTRWLRPLFGLKLIRSVPAAPPAATLATRR